MRKIAKIAGILVLLLWVIGGQAAASELEVKVNHLNLSLTAEGNLHVTEQYLLENPGEAFTGAGSVVSFPLPPDAFDVHYGAGVDEATARVEEGRLFLEQEFPSGEITLNFHYLIPGIEGSPHFFLEREFSYTTPNFFVMAPAGQLRVTGDQLEDQGVMAMGESQLHIYAGAFEQGDALSMMVLPDNMVPGTSGNNSGVVSVETGPAFHDPGHIRLWEQSPFSGIDAHLFMIIVVGVPIGVLIWYLLKRRRGRQSKTDLEREEEVFQRYLVREKYLKQKLVELEQQHSEGTVSDEDYEQQLAVYKKKLLEVRLKLKQFTE
ncbi:MAG: hypothetical protein GX262_08545 [Clostridia bacterium]|jgi:hypothetical protein|nr:hypothetical protein [Clostridia bacterium]